MGNKYVRMLNKELNYIETYKRNVEIYHNNTLMCIEPKFVTLYSYFDHKYYFVTINVEYKIDDQIEFIEKYINMYPSESLLDKKRYVYKTYRSIWSEHHYAIISEPSDDTLINNSIIDDTISREDPAIWNHPAISPPNERIDVSSYSLRYIINWAV